MSAQHLMDDHPKSPPFVINWSQYNQFVGRIPRVNAMPEPLDIERKQLRDYHAKAIENLTHYADDSDLRESDVKHYRKRALFHQTMVETIDKMSEVKLIDAIRKVMHLRNKFPQYSSNWYYYNNELSALVREWRKTNTLKSVK